MTIAYPPVTTSLPPFLLANSNLLALLEKHPFHQEISDKDVEEAVYLGYQPWQSRQPDHVFRTRWHALTDQHGAKVGHWVYPALITLVDGYLEFQHNKLHATLDTYGEWQNLLSRISSMPVQAAAYAQCAAGKSFGANEPPQNNGTHSVIYPFDPAVEDYIAREGLHETHLHLNGSTHAEWCWLRALSRPRQELIDFTKQYTKKNTVRELCHTINPELRPAKLYEWLRLARRLRCWLIAIADGRAERLDAYQVKMATAKKANTIDEKKLYSGAPKTTHQLLNSDLPLFDDDLPFPTMDNGAITSEMSWLIQVLARLACKPDPLTDRLLHIYLLLQNQYLQLVVQREDMYGFDQFQKLTLTDLREPAEKNYLYRFRQLSGPNKYISRVGWFEGRFTPKDSVSGNLRILTNILGDYLLYLRSHSPNKNKHIEYSLSEILARLEEEAPAANHNGIRSHLKLALVAHFVKQPWKVDKEGYRHANFRESLEKRSRVLNETMKRWPRLRHWLRGIDAAANELDASPEVFAPFFRVSKRQGLHHRSYHVGEDFPHLISGIRQVTDALELLDLGTGDRIGHGTALGIDPSLWLSTMPRKLLIKQGDWMLDLLSAWRYLHPISHQTTHTLSCEIARLAFKIFQAPVSCSTLDLLMHHRGLLPRFVFASLDEEDWDWRMASISDIWREEARLVDEVQDTEILRLLVKWWRDKDLLKRSETLIEVDANFLTAENLLILQQCAMKNVVQRRVVIETLPTSNVRISQYQHYRDHHSLRWMHIPGYEKIGDPNMLVSLGSDDPGIFSNDLCCDFYQLYAVLRESGLSDMDALTALAIANERGRQYRFHDKEIFG